MSTESTVVFLGVAIDIPASQVEELETRKHPLIAKARSVALQYYWANFGGIAPKYLFLLGKKIAIVGIENDAERTIPFSELEISMSEIRDKLGACGFNEEPQLMLRLLVST